EVEKWHDRSQWLSHNVWCICTPLRRNVAGTTRDVIDSVQPKSRVTRARRYPSVFDLSKPTVHSRPITSITPYSVAPAEIGGNRILLDGSSAAGSSTSARALKRGLAVRPARSFQERGCGVKPACKCRSQ